MSKPQGYLHSADESLFCLLILSLPYYHTLFYASISRVVLFCILAFLLLFLAKHADDITQAIRRCIVALCAGVANVYMQSRSQDDPLDFDYRLRPGVANQTNGLAIVRMMGLEV